tara:strand:+ start:5330 stop:5482 length:153 start_codon:yes stop_codon:yes gene_type:complete
MEYKMNNCCNKRTEDIFEAIDERMEERGLMLEIAYKDYTLIKNAFEQIDH